MITTRDVKRPPDNAAAREAAVRDGLAVQAAYVMHNSQPTPTQEEIDAILSGKPRPRRESSLPSPSMPPLHEQHARIAGAGNPLYSTRHLEASPPRTTPAPEGRHRLETDDRPDAAEDKLPKPAGKKDD